MTTPRKNSRPEAKSPEIDKIPRSADGTKKTPTRKEKCADSSIEDAVKERMTCMKDQLQERERERGTAREVRDALNMQLASGQVDQVDVEMYLSLLGTGHANSVNSVAFSPDWTKVLTGSSDDMAKLWNVATGAVIRTFTAYSGVVASVAYSPDGTKVLTGVEYPDNAAKLWNAATGAVIRTFTGHTDRVTEAVFSPDGTKVLTGSNDNTAILWDASTGTVIRTFIGHTLGVTSVSFSPDGTKVLTGSIDATAKLLSYLPVAFRWAMSRPIWSSMYSTMAA